MGATAADPTNAEAVSAELAAAVVAPKTIKGATQTVIDRLAAMSSDDDDDTPATTGESAPKPATPKKVAKTESTRASDTAVVEDESDDDEQDTQAHDSRLKEIEDEIASYEAEHKQAEEKSAAPEPKSEQRQEAGSSPAPTRPMAGLPKLPEVDTSMMDETELAAHNRVEALYQFAQQQQEVIDRLQRQDADGRRYAEAQASANRAIKAMDKYPEVFGEDAAMSEIAVELAVARIKISNQPEHLVIARVARDFVARNRKGLASLATRTAKRAETRTGGRGGAPVPSKQAEKTKLTGKSLSGGNRGKALRSRVISRLADVDFNDLSQ